LGDKINQTKMGRACSKYGRAEVHTGFWWGNLREGDHLKDSSIDGSITLKYTFEKWVRGHGLD
jgi:hypothetical protein